MATKKAYIVTDLGPGDGGKGGVVHKVSQKMRAHTVVKVGGAQGSHGVVTSKGQRFAFSQWGCGTFEGVRTHLTPNIVIHPEGILNEAQALRYECGILEALDLLTVDRRALCATPYHGITSRLKEMARGAYPRGTIGTGVGEAYRDAQLYPELAIYAGDLSLSDIRRRLARVRDQQRNALASIIYGKFLSTDYAEVEAEVANLRDDGFFEHVVRQFEEVARTVNIVDEDYMRREILAQDGVVVVESSHGILTDNFHGFHPHTSAIRTLPCFTHAMLADAGFDGEIVNLGVTRAYCIRHGAGPMPTHDPTMTEDLLPGSNKKENRYQGKVRVGPLDLVLLRYAIEVCGGPSAFDGLAITWFDQIQANGSWQMCTSYDGTDDRTYFAPSGAINVRRGEDVDQLEHQRNLGEQLFRCTPNITKCDLPSAQRDNLYSLCADTLRSELGVPVHMLSFGPTERDKVCR